MRTILKKRFIQAISMIVLGGSINPSYAIINGKYDELNSFSGVVNMGFYYESLDAFYSSCTGTLITPKIVLTAAHCVYQHKIDPTQIKISPRHNTRLFKKGFEVEKIEYYTNYVPGMTFMGGDVGLIFLKEEIKNAQIYKINSQDNTNSAKRNDAITIVGYGTRSPITGVDTNDEFLHFILTAIMNKQQTLKDFTTGADLNLTNKEKEILGGMQFELMVNNGGRYFKDKPVNDISSEFLRLDGGEGINQGDSGGPWFQTINNEKYLAAVTSTVSSSEKTETNPYTKLPETNKYAEESLGQRITNKHLCWIDSVAQTTFAKDIDCKAIATKPKQKNTPDGGIEVDGAVFNDPDISTYILKHYDILSKNYLNRSFVHKDKSKKIDLAFELAEFDPDLPGTQISIYKDRNLYAKVNAKIQKTYKDGSADYLAESRDRSIQLTFRTKGKLTLLQKLFDNHKNLEINFKSKESEQFIKLKTKYTGSEY